MDLTQWKPPFVSAAVAIAGQPWWCEMIHILIGCDTQFCLNGTTGKVGEKAHQIRRRLAVQGWKRLNKHGKPDPCGKIDLCPDCWKVRKALATKLKSA
jgi:hypothetical protein